MNNNKEREARVNPASLSQASLEDLIDTIKRSEKYNRENFGSIQDPKHLVCSRETAPEFKRMYPKCKVMISCGDGEFEEYKT